MSTTFTKEIFTSTIWTYEAQQDGSIKKVDSERTANSKFLFDTNGNPVMDPTFVPNAEYPNGRPYIVPADFSLDTEVAKLTNLYHTNFITNPTDASIVLLDFQTGGKNDLQRTDVYGNKYDGFVSDYTPAASLLFGTVSAALAMPSNGAEIGGGLLNFKNWLSNSKIDTSGEYFNDPDNVRNIQDGFEYYLNHISENTTSDTIMSVYDLYLDIAYDVVHVPEQVAEKVVEVLQLEKITVETNALTWYEDLWESAVELLDDVKEFGGEIVDSVENLLTSLIESSPTRESVLANMNTADVLQNEYQLNKLYKDGYLSDSFKTTYTQQISNYFNDSGLTVTQTLNSTGTITSVRVTGTDANGNNYTEVYGNNGTLLSRTTSEYQINGTTQTTTLNYSGSDNSYDSRTVTIYDGDGKALQSQVAVYNTPNNITEVRNYTMGELTTSGVIQGKATDNLLAQEFELALHLEELSGFSGMGTDSALLQSLGLGNTQILTTAFEMSDATYSGENIAENKSFLSNETYATWLGEQFDHTVTTAQSVFREFLTTTALTSKSDPYLASLQNGPLAVYLAQENPTTLNVLSAFKEVVLAGGVLSEPFKQGVATLLGTNVDSVNMLVAEGGSSLISILNAYEHPTAITIASALQQTLSAGIAIDKNMVHTTATLLGVNDATVTDMLAYGGAALSVISLLKDPSTQNIIMSTQQTVNILAKIQTVPELQNQLSYISTGLNNVMVAYNVYNFVKRPDDMSAVNAMLSVGMHVAPEFAVPLAAVLTIGELVAPKFTNEAVGVVMEGIDIINDFTRFVLTGTGDLAHSIEKAIRHIFSHCPLVLNLSGNDVWTTTLTNFSPTFDMNATGTKVQTGWITPDQAFLVRDINGNGVIDDATELFSDKTSSTATSGFGALVELDSNQDKLIDKNDTAFETLKLWIDKNSDGTTQDGELYTLAELGIASINLSVANGFDYNNGNIITDTSTFTYADGTQGQIADVIFTTKEIETVSSSNNLITMGEETTTVRLSNGQTMQIMNTSDNSNLLVTSTGLNLIAINGQNNTITLGETNDSIIVGNNTVKGGKGNDTYYIDSSTKQVVVENANEGIDTVVSTVSYTLGENLENVTLMGTNTISATGNTLNNTLIGNNSANTLDGGSGIDTLKGGKGDDVYIVDNSGDTVVENSNEGVDTIRSSVTYALAANLENLLLTGAAAINATGNELANTLTGNNGNNILDGGAGNDVLDGGAGVDTVSYASATSAVTVNLLLATAQATGGSGSDTLKNFENITGSAYNDTLSGDNNANILNGGAGADKLSGGLGDDTYVVDNTGDVVTEAAYSGTDTVESSITYTLGANLENLRLIGTAAINGSGNAFNNIIYAGAGNNIIDGGAGIDTVSYAYNTTAVSVNLGSTSAQAITGSGADTLKNIENLTGSAYNDTLAGNTGSNVLDGGLGADKMFGGAGDDIYYVDNIGDTTYETKTSSGVYIDSSGSSNDAGGKDTVVSSVNYTLGKYIEELRLISTSAINGTGNELDNTIYSGDGNNILDGGEGTDTLSYLYASSGIRVALNSAPQPGVSTFSSSNSGGQATGGSGTDTIKNFENLTGSSYNDTLNGNAGNNIINGGLGADIMFGTAGNDTYYVDNLNDKVYETTSASSRTDTGGIDMVISDLDWTLGLYVENLTLSEMSKINGTGNELNNILVGNSFDNILIGLNGDDTLRGGDGKDTLTGGAGKDIFVLDTVLNQTTNVDRITDFTKVEDKVHLENGIFTKLTATGTLSISNFAANSLGGAMDKDDYILFDTKASKLYYDADGNGSSAKILIASFDNLNGYFLKSSDFAVI